MGETDLPESHKCQKNHWLHFCQSHKLAQGLVHGTALNKTFGLISILHL